MKYKTSGWMKKNQKIISETIICFLLYPKPEDDKKSPRKQTIQDQEAKKFFFNGAYFF